MVMIEMKVYGLAVDEDSQAPVLILKDKAETLALPIWIGAMEAMAISLALNNVELPRPMTHDLMISAIKTLDATILSVDVVALRDGTYYAELLVEQSGKRKVIDCRPSDGIAIALRADAPISVSEEVLEQAATNKNVDAEPVIQSEDADKWTELLEKLNVDDSKYKM